MRAGMTDEDRQSRADYYRVIAEKLNRLAQRTHSGEVRRELLELAERFERIAEHAERWQSLSD